MTRTAHLKPINNPRSRCGSGTSRRSSEELKEKVLNLSVKTLESSESIFASVAFTSTLQHLRMGGEHDCYSPDWQGKI